MAGVIAGNPRSGTSMTMNLSAEAVGIDRIIGDMFPRIARTEKAKEQGEGESEAHHAMRMYIMEGDAETQEESLKKMKDMNPNGFYEHPQFTVRGIKYSPALKDDISKLEAEDKSKPYIIKLVNLGLAGSDPKYIDWVVYLIRHPWDIAKSQERLSRSQKFTLKDGRDVDLYDGVVVNDPDFYLSSTIAFANWKINNPDIPVHFVDFDDLIADPIPTLDKIADFTGVPEYRDAAKIINPKLRRSGTEREERPGLWTEAIQVHNWVLEGKWEAILEYAKKQNTFLAKRHLTYFCPRSRAGVAYLNCVACLWDKNEDFIKSGIERANANKWDWENEPCAFECGFDPDDENPKTISESIASNHWKDIADK